MQDFTPAERERLEAFLDMTYSGFKAHVAAGRHLSEEQVEAVAKGRVWSGEEAQAKGLVDALGGYETALKLAKEAAKIPPDGPFKLVVFPREKSTAELIADRLFDLDHDEEGGSSSPSLIERSLTALGMLAAHIEALTGGPATLHMPPLGDIR
jgi:protease-4